MTRQVMKKRCKGCVLSYEPSPETVDNKIFLEQGVIKLDDALWSCWRTCTRDNIENNKTKICRGAYDYYNGGTMNYRVRKMNAWQLDLYCKNFKDADQLIDAAKSFGPNMKIYQLGILIPADSYQLISQHLANQGITKESTNAGRTNPRSKSFRQSSPRSVR